MISIPGSLSFAKLLMMSSALAKSAGDARYASQDSFIDCPIQSRLQSVLGVRSFCAERNNIWNMFLGYFSCNQSILTFSWLPWHWCCCENVLLLTCLIYKRPLVLLLTPENTSHQNNSKEIEGFYARQPYATFCHEINIAPDKLYLGTDTGYHVRNYLIF